jgi:hypothetical protein
MKRSTLFLLALCLSACGEPDKDDTASCTWYPDLDEDGYGDDEAPVEGECGEAPSGHVEQGGDCDDQNPEVHPDRTDDCDGIDNDCDGSVDEDAAQEEWYGDQDGDGYGAFSDPISACAAPSGYVADDSDCNDGNDDVFPGAPEVCNGIDDDCDGLVDDADSVDGDLYLWYIDADDDGYGSEAKIIGACEQPTGFVADNTDCDDGDDEVFPGTSEICNEIDDDCDGLIDDEDEVDGDLNLWYIDHDGDGYGSEAKMMGACAQPTGYVADNTDCDDDEVWLNPGMDEVCNSIDDDCDGLIDDEDLDATDLNLWYIDSDGDGYGSDAKMMGACEQPSGFVDNDADCDDTDDEVNPDATEICDTRDNDCDGDVDAGYWGGDEICRHAYVSATGSLGDGLYWIDPVGYGAEEVYCDMSGAGWTLVYHSTNSGTIENGTLTGPGPVGTTPFTTADTGQYKLHDDVINGLRSSGVANDLKVSIDGCGLSGDSWHSAACTFNSSMSHMGTLDCGLSTRSGPTATDYEQSGHSGLSRWYIDEDFGYIFPNTHLGPVSGGTDHGTGIPDPYCTWYDYRHCTCSSTFSIWAY